MTPPISANSCTHNTITGVDGDLLYFVRAVYDTSAIPIWNEIEDTILPQPVRIPHVGAPDSCLEIDSMETMRSIDFHNGGIHIACGPSEPGGVIPSEYMLHQCFPNPFNPITTISFALPVASEYELAIINMLGQNVASFEGYSEPGIVELQWDASEHASGVYLYRLKAGDFLETKKMVLVK
jgi:hypothetical protein